ncbi:MAG TPA: 3'(2'),5'-bisphosphate nucleotidase CysQ [Acidimicrobiales bacterium]
MTVPDVDSSDDAVLAGQLADRAGRLLLEVRGSWSGPDPKELGRTGDRESNKLILAELARIRPADAILSEESADDSGRITSERVWIIDPLDGTREFTMPGRTDWAVHVALWEAKKGITAAAVATPALNNQVYVSGVAHAQTVRPERAGPLILVSDSRPPAFAGKVAATIGGQVTPMGSAGAKAMAVLRGDADAYVHAGGQWEWDSAAPVGVLLAAGMHASRLDGSPLLYNQPHPYLPDLVMCRADLAPALLEALEDELA